MTYNLSSYLQVFHSRRIATVMLLGFSSGLPLALTGGTLQAWMAVSGVDLRTIGVLALAGLPYTLKFIWSPFMDRFIPPALGGLGRRRGWILIAQLCLIAGIALMAFGSPWRHPFTLGALALLVAFASASQDIVIDAYRTDVLHEKERGIGAAVFVMGYRVAMIVSGAVALILSDRIGWRDTYLLMSVIMIAGMAATAMAPEPDEAISPPKSIVEAVWGPLRDFFSRRSAFTILLVIVMYKLGDAYAGTLTTAFLIRGLGFTPTDVGTINKGLGLVSLIIGALFGGTLMVRLGLYKSLMLFGILQALSVLSFMVLAWAGKSYVMMIFAVAFENLCGGMGTAAFVSLLMALCSQRYSATQYALLSSLAALGRIFIAPSSGYVVELAGWPRFFMLAAISAIPGLLLLRRVRGDIELLRHEAET
ncbi:MAG: MFS transporter [Dissulfurispiraceae bacterium]